jgi:hypothetical protein
LRAKFRAAFHEEKEEGENCRGSTGRPKELREVAGLAQSGNAKMRYLLIVVKRTRRERAEFLMRELAHRGTNQRAVVKGMAVQNGGLRVQSPELELRDLPGDTPNRLRKARAKELSES